MRGWRAKAWSGWSFRTSRYAASGALTLGADGFLVSVVAAAALGVFAAITVAAVDAGIPRTVTDPHSVRRGYSLVESARTVAVIAGPALAGLQDFGLSASLTAIVIALAGVASVIASMVQFARAVPAGTAMVLAVTVLAATAVGIGLAPGPILASARYALFSVPATARRDHPGTADRRRADLPAGGGPGGAGRAARRSRTRTRSPAFLSGLVSGR
ncbi:MAG: hypothetical protein ACRDRV_15285 [Pseudonocardiaceae bacterium]